MVGDRLGVNEGTDRRSEHVALREDEAWQIHRMDHRTGQYLLGKRTEVREGRGVLVRGGRVVLVRVMPEIGVQEPCC